MANSESAKQYKQVAQDDYAVLCVSVCVFCFFIQVLARSQLSLLLWRDTRQEADIKEWGDWLWRDAGAKAGASTVHTDKVGSLQALSLCCAYYGPIATAIKCDQHLWRFCPDAVIMHHEESN